ncbi:molecular chaperone [Jejubacter calystegiae]|uniref:Molecular chaperone n=1 Tax=Jejubacter calystegiae TaxID=2579935 RepID=A0A4P8YL31_9ENTR|nr:molecular chaperone [Jejubacter calystegiae]QCT21501.1 molecular chaperone [Jejubacter calystegiae]
MKMKLLPTTLALLSTLVAFSAHSAIIIAGTRVVYPEKDKEVSIKMTNNGKAPVLIQSWIDSGDRNSRPDNAQAPFTLTPPINRVDPGKGQSLRIRYTGEPLPKDKESIFYLNVLEIPAKVKNAEGKSMLQMAFRSRLKLFFRPDGLPISASDAQQQVKWSRQGTTVTATNPSPYFINVAYFSDDREGKKSIGSGGMIAPGATKTFTLSRSEGNYYPFIINDFGAMRVIDSEKK